MLGVALVVDNVANGGARPFFGWVSDQIGRENTMVIAFTLGGLAYLLLGCDRARSPWLFVLFAGLIFFTWGEIFSLFPSTCTDAFGPKYATTNTALLYTAKGTSALLVPFANMIKSATGSWYDGVPGRRGDELRRRAARAVRAAPAAPLRRRTRDAPRTLVAGQGALSRPCPAPLRGAARLAGS